MGLFSRIFGGRKSGGTVSGRNPGSAWTVANRFNRAKGGFASGYGAWTFGNIMNAHCSPEDIVEEFGLNKDDNPYGCDAYLIAYQEEYDVASIQYQEMVGYYMSLIENCQSEILERETEITELEHEIEELEQEIENLKDEMEMAEDPVDMEEIAKEIADCQEQIQELKQEIETLQQEIAELRLEIQNYYSEIEFLSIEEMINYDEVEKKAMEYACEFAQQWIAGATWIPGEVLHWAYYDISDHNR